MGPYRVHLKKGPSQGMAFSRNNVVMRPGKPRKWVFRAIPSRDLEPCEPSRPKLGLREAY